MTKLKWSPASGLKTLGLHPNGLTTKTMQAIYGRELRRQLAGLLARRLVARSDLGMWTITDTGWGHLAAITAPLDPPTTVAPAPTGKVKRTGPARIAALPAICDVRSCWIPVGGAGVDYGLCEAHGRKERNRRLKARDEAYRAQLAKIEAARAFTPSTLSVPPVTVRRQWLIA